MSLILTNRLKTAAELVRPDRKTVDVGTDHGYLPAFLVMSGKTSCAIAADIGTGPLENAKKTIEKYGLKDKISTVLSNGLEKIPNDTEEIIICGMGGTLIAEILSKAEWIKHKNIHLVLQPMTHSYDVRKFLCENGFYIDTEKFSTDDGRDYVVISAYFSGENAVRDDFYYYFGDVVTDNTETEKSYIKRQYFYVRSRFEGLKKSGNKEESEIFEKVISALKDKTNWSEFL